MAAPSEVDETCAVFRPTSPSGVTPVLVAASPSAGSEWRGQAAFCHGPGAPRRRLEAGRRAGPGGRHAERAGALGTAPGGEEGGVANCPLLHARSPFSGSASSAWLPHWARVSLGASDQDEPVQALRRLLLALGMPWLLACSSARSSWARPGREGGRQMTDDRSQ